MNSPAKDLADRLVAVENEAHTIADVDRLATCRVCEKLRRPLITLVGSAGYSSLLQRALTLAKRESTALEAVKVMSDGSMTGLEGAAVEASSLLVGHLIQLLMTFIGESLTLTFLQGIWPELEDGEEPLEKEGYGQQGQN